MLDLHPFLVHFPVAAVPLCVLLGLWSLVQRRKPGIRQAYRLCLVVALAFSLGAMITGDQAEGQARGIVPETLLEAHERFGSLTFWLLLVTFLIEFASLVPLLNSWSLPVQALGIVVAVAALITVSLAGHRGGLIVYKYGGGVGQVFGTSPNVTVAPLPATPPDSSQMQQDTE